MMEPSFVVNVASLLVNLVSATVATLVACRREKIEVSIFVVPVVYTLLDDFVNRLRRGRASHAPRVVHAGPSVRETEPVAAE